MATYCPEKHGPALYMECLECEDKVCRNKEKGPNNDRTRNKKI